MIYDNEYEYNYHNLADNADFIEEVDADEYYYDDGTDEPWCSNSVNDEEFTNGSDWDNYYHNLRDEIIDD